MDLHQDIGAYFHYIALWNQPGTIGTDFPERLERITGLSGKLAPEYSSIRKMWPRSDAILVTKV